MTATLLRRWSWVHKWTSLVCTAFMLLLCITGLPLIFHHEIGRLTGTEVEAPPMPAGTPAANLDELLAAAQARHPQQTVQFLFRDPDETALWMVALNDSAVATEGGQTVAVDARTAKVLAEPKFDEGFMYVMLKLHTDLFAGLPGKLFLGLMGMLLVAAIVSRMVLYAPFTRKLDFGTVRRERSTRVRWLDLHNLLGAVTIVWLLVVGATGVINTWADLVIKFWQFDQMAQMTAPYKNLPPPERLGSLDAATRAAQVTDSRELPWYVSALLVSQPLHFGDYGGLPLKIVWALLDLATIVVLVSGLYLWAKRKQPRTLAEEAGVRAEAAA